MKVNIPNPCTEKYENMSPSDLGRMCAICNTEVVDFTNWETKDIVAYIQKSNQKVCGKVKSQTLDETYSFRGKNWLAISASFLLFTSWASANAIEKTYLDMDIQPEYFLNKKNNDIQDTILVKFVDLKNNPLAMVVVKIRNSDKYFLSDEKGIVHFPVEKDKTYELKADYIGYNSKIIDLNSQNRINVTKITLEESDDTIGEVVVKAHFSFKKRIKFKIKRLFNIFSIKDED